MTADASAPRIPGFLQVVMVGAGALGVLGMVLSLLGILAFGLVPGPYFVNGRHVSPDEFFAFAIPALGSYLALSAMMVALSWGIRRGRLWVRPLMLTIAVLGIGVPLTLAYVSGVSLGRVWPGLGAAVLMIVVLWWQLYYDDDILAYYAALGERDRA